MASLIPQVNGSLIGDMASFGGRGAAFDGNTSQVATACAGTTGSPANCYVGKDWGSGVSHFVSEFKIWGPSNGAMAGNAAGTVQLYGSNSAPASPTNGTQLYTGSSSGSNAETQDVTGVTATTAYRYHWVTLTLGGGNNGFLAEVEFYETNVYSLAAGAASFTFSGAAAGLNKGKSLAAGAASFVLTGMSAGLTRALSLPASAASFVMTGASTTLSRGRRLAAAAASFIVTGQGSDGRRGIGFVPAAASFVVTAMPATLSRFSPLNYARRRLSDFALSKRRATDPALQQRRVTDPTLGD